MSITYILYAIGVLFIVLLVLQYTVRNVRNVRNVLAYEGYKNESTRDSMSTALKEMQKEYTVWANWINNFCSMWTEVIQQALQAEQTNITQAEYIVQLEIQYLTQLYTCGPQYPEKADYTFISQNLPSDTSVFGTTLDFMNMQIAKTLQQTQGALQGIAPTPSPVPASTSSQQSVESFESVPIQASSCTSENGNISCTFPLSASVSASTSASASAGTTPQPTIEQINAVTAQLKGLNKNLDTLNQKMQQAQAGLAQLNQYKESAQNGTLINQVNIPPASSSTLQISA